MAKGKSYPNKNDQQSHGKPKDDEEKNTLLQYMQWLNLIIWMAFNGVDVKRKFESNSKPIP